MCLAMMLVTVRFSWAFLCIYDSDGDPVDPGGHQLRPLFFRLNFIINTAVHFFWGGGVG